ncbi:MAG: GDYXXLXY domain-containing protein [Cyanobacteriota bacterium]
MTSPSDSPPPTPIWRFWIPLIFQAALILAVPAQALYTQLTGKTVILQTVPVDPYELLRGYSQTLRYNISLQENLRKLSGWKELPKQPATDKELSLIKPGTRFYVILEAPKALQPSAKTQLPQAWKPIAVSLQRPSPLPPNQVALKGLVQNGFIQYGLETYYIPEDQREQINTDLRAARPNNSSQSQQFLQPAEPMESQPQPPVVMEIKVDDQGKSVPVSLWARVGQGSQQQVRHYRF